MSTSANILISDASLSIEQLYYRHYDSTPERILFDFLSIMARGNYNTTDYIESLNTELDKKQYEQCNSHHVDGTDYIIVIDLAEENIIIQQLNFKFIELIIYDTIAEIPLCKVLEAINTGLELNITRTMIL